MSRSNLEALNGTTIGITLPKDEGGFTERQCPSLDCERIFKVKSGTGLTDVADCGCPYCGKRAAADQFFSPNQIEYVQQVTLGKVRDAMNADIGQIFSGLNSPNINVTHTHDSPARLYFHHTEIPTTLICSNCTCQFKVFGNQGLCPDCGELAAA